MRTFEDAANQISHLAFRPLWPGPTSLIQDTDDIPPDKEPNVFTKDTLMEIEPKEEKQEGEGEAYDPLFDEEADADGSSSDGDGGSAVAASLGVPSRKSPSPTNSFRIALPNSQSTASRTLPPPKPVGKLPNALDPDLGELSTDVLLGSCIDGQVLIWDRRSPSTARSFERDSKTPPWSVTVSLFPYVTLWHSE